MAIQQANGAIRSIGSGTYSDSVVSPDGSTLYVARGGTITAYDIVSGTSRQSWTIGTSLGGIDVSADGRYLVAPERQVGPSRGSSFDMVTDIYVYRLDLRDGTTTTYTAQTPGGYLSFWDASFTSNGDAIFTQNFNGSGWVPLTTLNFSTGTFTKQTGTYSQQGTLTPTPDRSKILFMPANISSAPVYVYSQGSGVSNPRGVYQDGIYGYNNGVQAISPTGGLIAQGSGLNIYDGQLRYLRSLSTENPMWTMGNVTGMTFSVGGDKLYLLDSNADQIFILSTADWSVLGGYSIGAEAKATPAFYEGSFGNNLLLTGNGRYLIATGQVSAQIIDTQIAVSDAGTSGNDSLTGTSSAEYLYGFAGNDTIDGRGGADTIYGGKGDDLYRVSQSASVIERAGEGTDTIETSSSFTLPANVEVLVLSGNAAATLTGIGGSDRIVGNDAANVIIGGGGDDTLIGNGGSDTINGDTGNDSMIGGAGDDSYWIDSPADVVAEAAGEGDDTVNTTISYQLASNVENAVIQSAASRIQLTGNELANKLTGGSGDDTLIGGLGADTLDGGQGADLLVYRSTAESTQSSSDLIRDFQHGVDILDVTALAASAVTFQQATDTDGTAITLVRAAVASGDDLVIRVIGTIDITDIATVPTTVANRYTGTNGADTLTGSSGDDVLLGLAGNDSLVGRAGNDTLDGGLGRDTMAGGPGDDTYLIDDFDRIEEAAGEGYDVAITSVSYGMGGAATSVEELRAATGTSAINLTGSRFNDLLVGNDGNNVLNGDSTSDAPGSVDTLSGGRGDDSYVVRNSNDVIIEADGAGRDTVFVVPDYLTAGFTLSANAEVETLTMAANGGSSATALIGNGYAQVIVGDYGNNVLTGGGTSRSGDQNDVLIGLRGDDRYVVDSVRTVVFENAGEGNDVVTVSAAASNFSLNAGTSVETLQAASGTDAINITGNPDAQTIIGNEGINILSGAGGGDTLIGLGGNDTYQVRSMGDQVVEANGGGYDVVFATVSYSLGANEVEMLSTVVQAANDPINLIGNYATQLVIGNYGNNVLNGGSGGIDTLIGLFGDDTYAVGDARVAIVESAGQGNDTVVTSVSYQLRNGVSVETLAAQNRSGTDALVLTGNEAAQVVAGNDGANTIDGRGGADTLVGGGGADVFAFTTAAASGNADTILDFQAGVDRIGLATDVFAAVTDGGIQAGEFVIGTAAQDGDDRLIYDQASGRLFYDADGNGAGAAVLFAQLSGGLNLTVANFVAVAPVMDLPA